MSWASVIGFFASHTDTLTKLMPLLVAAVVAYKVAQLAANVAQTLSVPAKIAEVVVNRQLVASNRCPHRLSCWRGGFNSNRDSGYRGQHCR